MRAGRLSDRRVRYGLLFLLLIAALAVGAWRSEELGRMPEAFAAVAWPWAAAALGANAASILLRACAFAIVLRQALPGGTPAFRHVASSFAAGVMANALLPARAGEVTRLAVLAPHLLREQGAWLTAGGSVFAQHLLDAVAQAALVGYVVYAADVPSWAVPALVLTIGGGTSLLVAAVLWVRRHRLESGPARTSVFPELVGRVERGLSVYRSPAPAAGALLLQCTGWAAELAGIAFAFRAFGIDAPLGMAAAVLLLTNVATLFPFWPGNVGLFQAAVAAPLLAYGIGLGHAVLFGVGLQAIELTVAVALGGPALAYEGVSLFALEPSRPLGVRAAAGSAEEESGREPERR